MISALVLQPMLWIDGGSRAQAQDAAQDAAQATVQDNASPRLLPTDIEPDPSAESPEDDFVHPAEIAAKAFGPPPAAKRLGDNLWINQQPKRVYFDGYVTMREGPLEMLACPVGSKEHESVIAAIPQSRYVHAALLAIGAKPGTPVAFLPNFVPATGQRIRVWVCYRDEQGQFQVTDARRWIRREGTDEHLQEDWVFGGSGWWKDPRDGAEYYRADGGDMICVSNFTTAMMDVPIASSADAAELLYVPFTERIPARGVPVRVVLVPIPLASDKPRADLQINPDQPPGEEVLPPPQ
jgi:hypothetical protein